MKFTWKKPFILVIMIVVLTGYGSTLDLGDFYAPDVTSEALGNIYFLDKPLALKAPLYYVNGRLFLPLNEMLSAVGGTSAQQDDGYLLRFSGLQYEVNKESDEQLFRQLHFEDNRPYISVYDFTQLFHLWPVFDTKNNKLSFYRREEAVTYDFGDTVPQKAYIRMEDITADGGISGNFSDAGLEKLRAMADYLYSKGQSYYIAWIPLYTNPPKQIQNDLTKNFNFYNASFIDTLDYMVNHNGHIVLHGLTHQSGDTVSAIGVEFGKDLALPEKEVNEKFQQAKEIAETLGYNSDIFEFPHYCTTVKEEKTAEGYFDVIYQQSPYAKHLGYMEKVHKWSKDTLYVPTPADYIQSADNLQATFDKIDSLQNGQIVSMFYHPYMDYGNISLSTTNGVRSYHYNETGIVPQLVKNITDRGLAFSVIEY